MWFLATFGPQTVAVASALFSTISILVTILAAFTQNNIAQTQQSVSVNFVVEGLSDKERKFETQTDGIRKDIADILRLDSSLVDIEKPRGFKFRVHLYINNVQYKDEDYKELMEKAVKNGTVAAIIRKNWKLNMTPKIVSLKYEERHSSIQERNSVKIVALSPKSPSVAAGKEKDSGIEIVYKEDVVEGDSGLEKMPEVIITPMGGPETLEETSDTSCGIDEGLEITKPAEMYADKEGHE